MQKNLPLGFELDHLGTRHLDARHYSICHPLNLAGTRGCCTIDQGGILGRQIYQGQLAVCQVVSRFDQDETCKEYSYNLLIRSYHDVAEVGCSCTKYLASICISYSMATKSRCTCATFCAAATFSSPPGEVPSSPIRPWRCEVERTPAPQSHFLCPWSLPEAGCRPQK